MNRKDLDMYSEERRKRILRGLEAMQQSIIDGSGQTLACAVGDVQIKPVCALMISTPNKIETTPLSPGEEIIGRGKKSSVQIEEDTCMSRTHFCLTVHGKGQLTIRDLDSSNGTFVNGTRVISPQPLEDGDLIKAGQTEILVLPIEALE